MPTTSEQPRISQTELTLPASLAAISATRAVLDEILRAHGWNQERIEDVVLAASEAIANAIEHGSDRDDDVTVSILHSAEVVELRVADTGRGGRVPRPSGETARPPDGADRGRGFLIMRALAHEVELSPSDLGGTETRLVFPADGLSG